MSRKYTFKTKKQKADKAAWAACSGYIRAWTVKKYKWCPFCLERGKTSPVECCFHFISRRHLATKYDEDNLIGSCMICNGDERYHPSRYTGWFIRNFGYEKWLALEARSRTIVQLRTPDYLEIEERYKKKLEKFCSGHRYDSTT